MLFSLERKDATTKKPGVGGWDCEHREVQGTGVSQHGDQEFLPSLQVLGRGYNLGKDNTAVVLMILLTELKNPSF